MTYAIFMGKFLIGIIILVLVVGVGYTMVSRQAEEETEEETTNEEEVTNEVETVKIGFISPLTGDAASYGESIKRGVDLAAADLRMSNLEIIYEDSKCEGKEAVNAITKLIDVDKVQVVIGEACSGATLAAFPVAKDNKVVLISPASTSPKLSEAGAYFFRTVPSDALQGNFGAELVDNKGFSKLAILYSNEEYGIGFTDVLTSSFEELGGEVVASESFEQKATDVRTQITKIKAAEPDALYIISNSPSAAVAALKQLNELELEVVVFGSEGLKSPDIIEGAGDAAEGLILTSVSSGTTDFKENHNDAYDLDPGPFAAQGYDALLAIAMAIEEGAVTGEDISKKLVGIEFEGASGNIAFDKNGEISGNYDVFEVKEGEFVIVGEEADAMMENEEEAIEEESGETMENKKDEE
jgi:branched-chain amino acid transport system substrate-binding protein